MKSAKVTGTNYNYQVFFLTNGRACPAIARMPVYEEVLVDTIYTDMAPLVKVNGKRGVIR